MSKYFFDYTDTVIGANLGAVTLRSGGAPTYMPIYGAPAFKKRYLNFVSDVVTTRSLTHNAVDADAARADFDLLTCIAVNDMTAQSGWLIGRASGTASLTGYAALALPGSNVLQLLKSTAGVNTVLNTVGFTFTAGKSYFFRFRASGTTLMVKAWASDVDEPAYQISLTDSTFTAAGSVGVGSIVTAIGQTVPFNFFSVGTGGEVAPLPLTNVRYTAWLNDQTSRREVLTEFTASGYDSAGVAPFLKTRNVYLSRFGFASKSWDTPASRAYPALIKSVPTFSQKMPTGMTGEAVTGFGDLVLDNSNGIPSKGAGEVALDSWLRVRWNRSFIRLYLGDPSWPRHDFRAVIVGRIGRPTTPTATTLSFKIQNLSSAFNVPLTTQKFASGQFIGAYKPVLIGAFNGNYGTFPPLFFGAFVEPPMSDKTALVFSINDGPFNYTEGTSLSPTVFDNLKFIGTQSGLATTAVNTTTGLLTVPSHGMVLNYRVRFTFANFISPPAGFSQNVDYFVIASGLTINDFKLSATPGGGAIIPTSATTGTAVDGFGYSFNTTAGTMTLVTPPVGRVTLSNIAQTDASNFDNLFRRSGLSLDFKEQASFTTYASAIYGYGGLFYQPGGVTLGQAFIDHATGTQSWYGFTPDGLMRVGFIALPTSTPVMTFNSADYKNQTLKMADEIPAIDFTKAQLTYAKWFLAAGPFQSTDARATQGKTYYSIPGTSADYATYGDLPIDNRPDRTDADVSTNFDLISPDYQRPNQIVTLYLQRLGIFEVPVRLRALELTIGDTISLTDDRLGFRQWTSGAPASPDNTATIDSRLCVVIGIDVNLNGGPFPVTLTLMRRVPGYYPAADLT